MTARLTHDDVLQESELSMDSGTPLQTARVLGVLGMHRSGTSLVAGLLANSGATAGSESSLLPGDRRNATGYYEQRDVVALNDDILAYAGACWWAPPDSSIIARSEWVTRARETAETVGIMGRERPLAVFKDPRISFTWPVWTHALRRNIFPLIVVRHPLEVARSLWERDAMPIPVGLALWEQYVCAIFSSLGEQSAQLVHYDALVNQPGEAQRWLAELLTATGADDPSSSAQSACDLVLRTDEAARTLRDQSSDSSLTGHQQALWTTLAMVPNGTFIRPSEFRMQFQFSASSRDTIAAYRERTDRLVSQSSTIAALTEERAAQAAKEQCMLSEFDSVALARDQAAGLVAGLRTEVAGLEGHNSGLEKALIIAESNVSRHQSDADALRAMLTAEREEQRLGNATQADLSLQNAALAEKSARLEVACEHLRSSAATLATSHREALTRLERALAELDRRAHVTPEQDPGQVITTLRAQVHQLGVEQHLMHQSWTWRIGRALLAPLRVCKSLVRRSSIEAPAHD